LVDELLAVRALHDGAGDELGRVQPEPHRAALVDDRALLVHQVDDRVRCVRVELARVRPLEPARVTRELDHRALHPAPQPEAGDEVLTRVAGSGDLSLDTAEAEPARDHDAVELTQTAFGE